MCAVMFDMVSCTLCEVELGRATVEGMNVLLSLVGVWQCGA